MTRTIHNYHPTHKQWIQVFCNDFYNKGKSRRLFDAVLHQGKRWWTYGMAVIVAHAVTGHGLYNRSIGLSSTRFFSNNNSSNTLSSTTHTLMMELTLWTAGFGLAWYTWLSHVYMSQVKEMTQKWMTDMDRVCTEPKSNVWVMIDDGKAPPSSNNNNNNNNNNNYSNSSNNMAPLAATQNTKTDAGPSSSSLKKGKVLGVAMLQCHQVSSNPVVEEGQIQVAALGSRVQLALVENAIQFARQQGIKVITQEHKKNRLDSFF